jgi:hypothetical protein
MTTDDSIDTTDQADASGRVDAFAVTVDKDMRVRDGEFDGARARRELFDWATDGDETDLRKAARGFAVADLADDPTRADLKLPVAYVEDGRLVAIGNGLRNALARLSQTEGLSAQVRASAKDALEDMLERLNEKSDDADLSKSGAFAALAAMPEPARAEAKRLGIDVSTPITAATLAAQMDDSGRVFRSSRMSLHLDDRQTTAIKLAISVAEANGGQADEATMRAVGDAFRRDGFDDQLTDEGFWRGAVLAARTGTQVYSNGVTTWREFRAADEVGADESLASWSLKAFTDDHPPVLVTPANYREYAVGSIGQDAALTEPAADGQQYVRVTILVGDLEVLRKIRDGKVELSAGYTVIPVKDSGTDPVDGEAFTIRQTDIRINHLSLVDAGRAGPLARIELDGSAWELPQSNGDTMTTDDKNDQLDPETSMMLLESIKAYLTPESPEAGEAALQSMASMMGLEPDAIREALATQAPEPEMEAAMENEHPEMIDVELADGIVVNVPPAAAQTLTDHLATQAERVTAIDAEARATYADKLAAMAAEQAVDRRSLERLQSLADQRERSELLAQVDSACPDLVNQWRKINGDSKTDTKLVASLNLNTWDGGKITERPITAMRRAVIENIDATYTEEFEAARSEFSGDAWDNYIGRIFARELREAAGRLATADKTPDPVATSDDVLRISAFGRGRR